MQYSTADWMVELIERLSGDMFPMCDINGACVATSQDKLS